MKAYHWLSTFLLLCFILSTPSVITAQSFKGKWQGNSDGEVGLMVFDKAGYVAFIINNEQIGGKKFVSSGVELSMRFEYDDTVQPHSIDFIMSTTQGVEVKRMRGIYKFVNAKTLILNMDFSRQDRPQKFDPDNPNQISMTKIKS